jgi:CheY-like chemotaxis protein
MVLDLRLPDMSGFEVLQEHAEGRRAGRPARGGFHRPRTYAEEDAQLHTMARSIVVKGAASPERLLRRDRRCSCTRCAADLPVDKQRMLERLHASDEMLAGRTVLVVDDDTRNIFAPVERASKRRGMHVLTATTGQEAISVLEKSPRCAIVLMDIMMPEMDGYQTIALIRRQSGAPRLPIIALTAKAMKGDREKCLEAGASDYLAKPVNTEQLFSALRALAAR